MAILGWIATRFLSLGIGRTFVEARSVAIMAICVVVVLGTAVGGCLLIRSHDRAVVAKDDLEERAAGAERDLRGVGAADAAVKPAASEFQAEQAAIEKGKSDAVAKDPEGARRGVGPASQSYYDQLRAREAANR